MSFTGDGWRAILVSSRPVNASQTLIEFSSLTKAISYWPFIQIVRASAGIADEDTECLLFPAWEFTALLAEHPELALPIMRTLIARLHKREQHDS